MEVDNHQMSRTHSHGEALRSDHSAGPGGKDPTRTTSLRQKYAAKLRGKFADINTQIRKGVVDEDVFGLEGEALAQPLPTFEYQTDPEKVDGFMEWLRRQQKRGVLEVIQRDGNTYVRSAYSSGIRYADARLNEQGVQVPDQTLQSTFNQPVHRDALQLLYTRNYEALQGITTEVSKQVSDELTQGFAQGWNPNKIARNITDRVDKIGKTRATVMARTEVINAHSTATLNRFEQAGASGVTVKAEWSTAGDRRVCPICQALEGNVYTIKEARSSTFRYSAGDDEAPSLSGEYPVKPPAHPQCRCALLPVVN